MFGVFNKASSFVYVTPYHTLHTVLSNTYKQLTTQKTVAAIHIEKSLYSYENKCHEMYKQFYGIQQIQILLWL